MLPSQEFLQSLMAQQFEVLHPLSSYQRRNFALSILQLTCMIFEDHPLNTSIPPLFNLPAAASKAQVLCLLESLQDSYDANRAIAFDLLLKQLDEKLGFEVSCPKSTLQIFVF